MPSKIISSLQMPGLFDLRASVGIAAAAGQQHPLIMEADVIDYGKLIIGHRLLKGPEKIISCGHEQRTVPDGIFFIPAQRRIRILLRNAVKAFNEGLKPGGEGPEIQRGSENEQIRLQDLGNHIIKIVLLNAGLSIAAGVAAKTALHIMLQKGDKLHLMVGRRGAFGKAFYQPGCIAVGAASPPVRSEFSSCETSLRLMICFVLLPQKDIIRTT